MLLTLSLHSKRDKSSNEINNLVIIHTRQKYEALNYTKALNLIILIKLKAIKIKHI